MLLAIAVGIQAPIKRYCLPGCTVIVVHSPPEAERPRARGTILAGLATVNNELYSISIRRSRYTQIKYYSYMSW